MGKVLTGPVDKESRGQQPEIKKDIDPEVAIHEIILIESHGFAPLYGQNHQGSKAVDQGSIEETRTRFLHSLGLLSVLDLVDFFIWSSFRLSRSISPWRSLLK
jgi:hypothetical protein